MAATTWLIHHDTLCYYSRHIANGHISCIIHRRITGFLVVQEPKCMHAHKYRLLGASCYLKLKCWAPQFSWLGAFGFPSLFLRAQHWKGYSKHSFITLHSLFYSWAGKPHSQISCTPSLEAHILWGKFVLKNNWHLGKGWLISGFTKKKYTSH